MKYKLASIVLGVYAAIGFTITFLAGIDDLLKMLVSFLLYGVIPTLCAVGLWNQSRISLLLSIALFTSQCIRRVGVGSVLPHIAPITFSLPVSSFEGAGGYLLDFFAILMVLFLAWLFLEKKQPSGRY